METHGCDINPTAVDYAQRAAERAGITCAKFFRLNALVDRLPDDYDVVMCTLFLHHLTDADARELLRRMAQAARRCVLVDDLRRNRLGYFFAWAGAAADSLSHRSHRRAALRAGRIHHCRNLSARARSRFGQCSIPLPLAGTISDVMEKAMNMTDGAVADIDAVARTTWDAIVIGAGPAAHWPPGRPRYSGLKTLLVDAKIFPREKVCGGYLNRRALEVLQQTRLEHLASGSPECCRHRT